MKTMKSILITLTVSLFFMGSASSSNATVLRAFVSSTGNDANAATNCAQTAPCKTFAGAFPTVTPGGELVALDTAGYGPLTNINKAITIAAVPGETAFVVAAAGTAAFTVNGGAGDLIILRNLSFNGSGAAGTTGVQHNSGKLSLSNCRFAQLTTGLNLVNSKADAYECEFTGNTTAVSVNGTGWDPSMPLTSTAVALLTFHGGSIKFNTTAMNTVNPGANLSNIVMFGVGNFQGLTSIAHNTNYMTSSGAGCPCNFPASSQMTTNPK